MPMYNTHEFIFVSIQKYIWYQLHILDPNIESTLAELIKNYTMLTYIPSTCTFFVKKGI